MKNRNRKKQKQTNKKPSFKRKCYFWYFSFSVIYTKTKVHISKSIFQQLKCPQFLQNDSIFLKVMTFLNNSLNIARHLCLNEMFNSPHLWLMIFPKKLFCLDYWILKKFKQIPYQALNIQQISVLHQSLRRKTLQYFSTRDLGIFEMDMCTQPYIKLINGKDPTYSTGNSAQCCVAAWMREEIGGESIHVYVCLSSFAIPLTLTPHC